MDFRGRPAAIAALLAASGIGLACSPTEPPDPRPNVLLITVDTLRADRLGTYGQSLATSPRIDAWAAEAVVFERALAASASTAPSHASIMTSRYPREHSIGTNNGGTRLTGSPKTLAERFQAAGYATGAFVGNVMLQPRTGFDRGFDVFDGELLQSESNRDDVFERIARDTTQRALAWLHAQRDRPVFLWVHYQDPHGPYLPPQTPTPRLRAAPRAHETPLPVLASDSGYGGIPAYQAIFGLALPSDYESRYAEEVLYADAWIGTLLDAVAAHASGREAVVLLTADHGESLGEDGHWFAHGHSSLPHLAHVPLILRAPGLLPGRRGETVHHVDIAPTLLALAGLAPDENASGVDLGALLGTPPQSLPKRYVYTDIGSEVSAYHDAGLVRVTGVEEPLKPTEERGTGATPLWLQYRWQPGAAWELDRSPQRRPRELEIYLEGAVPESRTPSLELDTIERLRALGYGVPE